MKKEIPILIAILAGVFAVTEFYIPHFLVEDGREELLGWAQAITAAAFVLGGINILQVNVPKVRRREHDWPYKVVLITGAVVMGLAGSMFWHTFTGDPDPTLTVTATAQPSGSPDMATVLIETDEPDALVKVGPAEVHPATPPGPGVVAIDVPPGKHAVKIYMRPAGYSEVTGEIDVVAGQTVVVRGTPTMLWGPSGRMYVWIYDHIFAPCNSTMFALLAFFVASAAFRAFRARNVEAALLLGSAIIILVAQAPIGRWISPVLPEISDWIRDIPNNAGRRAIMMGAAIGAIATGLRIILGLERSHLGSD